MKKTVIRYLVGILALASFLISGCSNLDDQVSTSYKGPSTEIIDSSQPSNTGNEPTPTNPNNFKEVASVLNREIFIFKEDSPELYTVSINDMDQTVAYADNWTFSKILNESNYKDIKWEVSSEDNNVTIVAFNGTARINDAVIYVQFYIFNNGKPLALSLYLYSEKTDTAEEISAKRFLEEDKNLNNDLALIYADASISNMLTIMAENAIIPASSTANKNTTSKYNENIPDYSETAPPPYIPPATTHAHSYGEWQSDSATNHARYCSCGEKQAETHTYGAGVITKEATESSEGIKKFTCKKCNYFKEEIIPIIVPVLSKEELEQQKMDQAGVLPENRYDTYTPDVIVTGYMKDNMTFVLDEKIALKGYWEDDRWDILEELQVALHYNLQKGKRYKLSGTLRYYSLGDVQIIEELE